VAAQNSRVNTRQPVLGGVKERQRGGDRLDHTVQVFINILIREPQKPDTERLDELLPLAVVDLRFESEVAISIELDRESGLDAYRSMLYGPTLYWRRNFLPSNRLPRNRDHKITSAFAISLRK